MIWPALVATAMSEPFPIVDPRRDGVETKPDGTFELPAIAAGEAIDLSAAAVLWFVEPSFMPKDMLQMSLRITNYTQTRQCFVRVCVIENSIDEAAQTILLRKWTSIRKVLTPC